MSPRILDVTNTLREFLFKKVYNPNIASKETEQARKTIRLLYLHLLKHNENLPEEYALRDDSIERKVTDYIAGMTDHYASRMAEDISA